MVIATVRKKSDELEALKNTYGDKLIINISSKAGSISKCWRTNLIEYGMAKAALNMATMNLALFHSDMGGTDYHDFHLIS